MELIDTHAHLTDVGYNGLVEGLLERSRAAGVDRWITVGTDLADSSAAVALAGRYDGMFCTVGVHPHEAGKQQGGYVDELGELGAKEKVVAIGEVGLDYYYDFSPRDKQKHVFEEQLGLAKELGLPVVVHCRDAFDDCLGILNEWNCRGMSVVFHCFSGDKQLAKAVLDMGCFLSFTGTITFKKAETARQVVRYVPLERVMLETDCPYLSPEPRRKIRPNEPALLVHIADKLAEIKELSVEEIAQATGQNSRLFFGMSEEVDSG